MILLQITGFYTDDLAVSGDDQLAIFFFGLFYQALHGFINTFDKLLPYSARFLAAHCL